MATAELTDVSKMPAVPLRQIDLQLWEACAGGLAKVPAVGSRVVYWPQGHAEANVASTSDASTAAVVFPPHLRSATTCKVVQVMHLAEMETDEVYARLVLQPEPDQSYQVWELLMPADSEQALSRGLPLLRSSPAAELADRKVDSANNLSPSVTWADGAAAPAAADMSLASPTAHVGTFDMQLSVSPRLAADGQQCFVKTLTQSDANNGGGFSVPRYCAETIFPPLNYAAEPPLQSLVAQDLHGGIWKFRHIYRGTPRRHLLTTGWSTFVNAKKLVAGDAVVFFKSSSGHICLGVRRALWPSKMAKPESHKASPPLGAEGRSQHRATSSSLGAGRLPGKGGRKPPPPVPGGGHPTATGTMMVDVIDAAEKASKGLQFEVAYYPRSRYAHYCVALEHVAKALSHPWRKGMRCRLAIETDDVTRMGWLCGTVLQIRPLDPLVWPQSLWRSLQVEWDEPAEAPWIQQSVCPWEVEIVPEANSAALLGEQVAAASRKRPLEDLSEATEGMCPPQLFSRTSHHATEFFADSGRQEAEPASTLTAPSQVAVRPAIVLFGQSVSPSLPPPPKDLQLKPGDSMPLLQRPSPATSLFAGPPSSFPLFQQSPPPSLAFAHSLREGESTGPPTTARDGTALPKVSAARESTEPASRSDEALCLVFCEGREKTHSVDLRQLAHTQHLLDVVASLFGVEAVALRRRLVHWDPMQGWRTLISTPWPHIVTTVRRAIIVADAPVSAEAFTPPPAR